MSTNLKQKAVIFSLMALLFLGSVFLKQFMESGSWLPERSSGSVMRLEEVEDPAAETEDPAETSVQTEEAEAPAVVSVPALIVVDVEGAVAQPGVVQLPEGSRVYEAVEAAGGLLETADSVAVNLAEKVSDGSAVYIPFQGEETGVPIAGISSGQPAAQTASSDAGGLVNINTADKSALMQLPGIGEVTAQSIIDYRESAGAFQQIEDIKSVSGIGDAKFERIRERITVS